MHQDYKVISYRTPMEIKNNYFQECVKDEKVNIVITTKRKYACLAYDFDTLNLGQKEIKDASSCQIEEKINAYALEYADKHHLPQSRYPKTITDTVGGFEFYIEDSKKVGDDIAKIIEDIIESGCMTFRTLEEKLASMDSKARAEIVKVLSER